MSWYYMLVTPVFLLMLLFSYCMAMIVLTFIHLECASTTGAGLAILSSVLRLLMDSYVFLGIAYYIGSQDTAILHT